MPLKPILPFGDPILRKKSKPVAEFGPGLAILLDEMVEILYAEEGRAGLAAPQVGVLRQVIVMDCGKGLIELINPEILETRGEQIESEACLSFPGYSGVVKRANFIRIKSRTRDGKTFILDGEAFLAKCIQHEMDHLNGILYIDRVIDDLLFKDETNEKADLGKIVAMSKPASRRSKKL